MDALVDLPQLAEGDRLTLTIARLTKTGGIMEDRRGSIRTSADWPVKIITPENFMEGEVINVSLTGAFIKCKEPLSAREKCRLIMELPQGKKVDIDAEVIWSTPPDADEESWPRGMGVRSLW